MSDKELIKNCLEYDRKSQKVLFEKYASPLLSTVKRYVYDGFYAEDVFLKGFEKIFNNIERFKQDKGDFIHWAKRIMINESLNHLRTQKHFLSIDHLELLNTPESQADIIGTLRAMELQHLVKSLKQPYGIIFNMIEDGYKYSEVSKELNLNEATCRSYYQRSKKMLQDLILQQEKINIL